jgi:hypothetical protein
MGQCTEDHKRIDGSRLDPERVRGVVDVRIILMVFS